LTLKGVPHETETGYKKEIGDELLSVFKIKTISCFWDIILNCNFSRDIAKGCFFLCYWGPSSVNVSRGYPVLFHRVFNSLTGYQNLFEKSLLFSKIKDSKILWRNLS
jgi:hypothetical protein